MPIKPLKQSGIGDELDDAVRAVKTEPWLDAIRAQSSKLFQEAKGSMLLFHMAQRPRPWQSLQADQPLQVCNWPNWP